MNDAKMLEGHIAFVTGSGRGLGYASPAAGRTRRRRRLHDRSQEAPAEFGEFENLDHSAATIAELGVRTCAVVGDIGDEPDTARMAREVEAKLGSLTVLVNSPAETSPQRAASLFRTTRSECRWKTSGRSWIGT